MVRVLTKEERNTELEKRVYSLHDLTVANSEGERVFIRQDNLSVGGIGHIQINVRSNEIIVFAEEHLNKALKIADAYEKNNLGEWTIIKDRQSVRYTH